MGSGGGFGAGSLQVGLKRVEDNHRKLGAEGVEFRLAPAAIQTRSAGNVLGKSMAIVAFAGENVPDEPPCMHVVDATAGLAFGIRQTEVNFARIREFLAVVPGLRSVDLGMMAAGTRVFLVCKLIGRIEVEDALAGITNHGLLPGADLVVGLRPQHDLA